MSAENKSFVREIILERPGRLDTELRASSEKDLQYLSRNSWKTLFHRGKVTDTNGRKMRGGMAIKAGTTVRIELPVPELGILPCTIDEAPDAAPVWENIDFLVWNKESGVPTLPVFPWETRTCVNQIYSYLLRENEYTAEDFRHLSKPPYLDGGLVQRLDNFSSGLVLAAKNIETKKQMQSMIENHEITKEYLVVVMGQFPDSWCGEREVYILPEKNGLTRIFGAVDTASNGVPNSVSVENCVATSIELELLGLGKNHSLLRVRTCSGQRHIVRAALSGLGYPLSGDHQYQTDLQIELDASGSTNFLLHAHSLAWESGGENTEFSVQAPEKFLSFCAQAGIEYEL